MNRPRDALIDAAREACCKFRTQLVVPVGDGDAARLAGAVNRAADLYRPHFRSHGIRRRDLARIRRVLREDVRRLGLGDGSRRDELVEWLLFFITWAAVEDPS